MSCLRLILLLHCAVVIVARTSAIVWAHESGAACPNAPTSFHSDVVGNGSNTTAVSFAVQFTNATVTRTAGVWARIADSACIPHQALVIESIATTTALASIDCRRVPTSTTDGTNVDSSSCDARGRARFLEFLADHGGLVDIGVEAIVPPPSPTGDVPSTFAAERDDTDAKAAPPNDRTVVYVLLALVGGVALIVAAGLVAGYVAVRRRNRRQTNTQPPPRLELDAISAADESATSDTIAGPVVVDLSAIKGSESSSAAPHFTFAPGDHVFDNSENDDNDDGSDNKETPAVSLQPTPALAQIRADPSPAQATDIFGFRSAP
uniref:Uncharacterized protein n=1 Tax=Neobodo designis TaxID=312471 RepID=A0A7S1LUC2_NEODS|mmetsp:Transcript_283/g.1096  ORF Transcript_283/g.1096 Transcript_283/m.1096 type:complete len:321 (+) Transcript_283:84-1046(+)|eukprot:CAMPEP_0174850326 /NCGR_PEP_ID=MMETSP1114-20130205/19168_1 /TAXON_ID=312471 /ORGANISM="Neobodo designis, Strain CCAP 1951/1" /LENGTH=320 /DNA_ID=CAMNT_0016084781 /DNA_START=83 /DNA_END=1045 /DNA_ORIENTATION=+